MACISVVQQRTAFTTLPADLQQAPTLLDVVLQNRCPPRGQPPYRIAVPQRGPQPQCDITSRLTTGSTFARCCPTESLSPKRGQTPYRIAVPQRGQPPYRISVTPKRPTVLCDVTSGLPTGCTFPRCCSTESLSPPKRPAALWDITSGLSLGPSDLRPTPIPSVAAPRTQPPCTQYR